MPFYVQRLPGHFAVVDATYKRCWYPRRCIFKGKWLFLRKAYFVKLINMPKHDGILRDVTYKECYTWIERDTYITMKLKGEI